MTGRRGNIPNDSIGQQDPQPAFPLRFSGNIFYGRY
jgi:hypothetical protein